MQKLLQELASKDGKTLDQFIAFYSSLVTDFIMDSYPDIPNTTEGKAYIGYCVSNGLEVKSLVTETILPSEAINKVSFWAACQPGFDYAKLREDAVSTLTDEDIKAANIQIGDVALYEYLYIAKREGWPTKISSTLTLYHGSSDPDFEPKPYYENDKTDYGSGLYLTPYIELAKEWAAAKNDQEAYLYTFELNTNGLTIFDFEQVNTLVWLSELCKHYKEDLDQSNANLIDALVSQYNIYQTDTKDILFGWRGDSAYTDILDMALSGKIGVEQIKDILHLGDLKVQYCLKSKRAYKQLKKAIIYKTPIDAKLYNAKYNDRMTKARDELSRIKFAGTELAEILED